MFATIDDVGSILGTAKWCTRAAGSMFAGAEGEDGMKIKWYGHACFRVEGGGVSIVTDPYTPEVAGLDPMEEPADVVIMSSATDRFHSNAAMVPGDPKILNALEIADREPVEVNGVEFEALPTHGELEAQGEPGRERYLPLRGGGSEHLAPGGSGQPPDQ